MHCGCFVCLSNLKCYPWLETEANAAGCLVSLYTQLTETLHHKFRGGCEAGTPVFRSAAVFFLMCCRGKFQRCVFCELQNVCCLDREVRCGCVWCSTARAALLPVCPSTSSTCTTHTSAACPGGTCTLTLCWWSSSSMWDTLHHLKPSHSQHCTLV